MPVEGRALTFGALVCEFPELAIQPLNAIQRNMKRTRRGN
jgi:hypothetical protein